MTDGMYLACKILKITKMQEKRNNVYLRNSTIVRQGENHADNSKRDNHSEEK